MGTKSIELLDEGTEVVVTNQYSPIHNEVVTVEGCMYEINYTVSDDDGNLYTPNASFVEVVDDGN